MRMKKFLICLTVVFLALSLVDCKLKSLISGGSSGKPGHGKPGKPCVVETAQGIYKIQITSKKVAFRDENGNGYVFGDIGTYDEIKGIAYGLVDPNDPRNQVITDINLAETNADGMVEYEADFYILTPTDPTKASRRVFYEPPNRGQKRAFNFNQMNSVNGVDRIGELWADAEMGEATTVPRTAPSYPAFLFHRGWTHVWSGWDMEPMNPSASYAVDPANRNDVVAKLPKAYNPDGSSITGPSYEWITSSSTCNTVYYSPVNANPAASKLTRRHYITDIPQIVPPNEWKWNGPGTCNTTADSISMLDPATGEVVRFQSGWIYELEYTAKDPYVAMVGFSAMRDFISFIRNENADSLGTPNPIAGLVDYVLVWAQSQPGRLMNDFVYWGFNEDLQGRMAIDGTMNWIGAGNGVGINYRFAQVGRTEMVNSNHIAQLEGVFPSSYTTTTDELSGKTDGRNLRCTASNTCPKVMVVFSANEMFSKNGSLLTAHPNTGLDVVEPDNVRNYLIAGSHHGQGEEPTQLMGSCMNFETVVDPWPPMRGLYIAMEKWIVDGTPPPPSQHTSVDLGTAVFLPTVDDAQNLLGIGMVPLADMDFPAGPLFKVDAFVAAVRNHWNYGPRFDQGIMDIVPPISTGYYKSSVPKVDPSTGNQLAGLLLPEVVAPLGTTTGWSVQWTQKEDGTDGCGGDGSFIPFALYTANKLPGDTRPSLQELYGPDGTVDDWKANWLAKRAAAAQALYEQGYLLENDRDNYTTSGKLAFHVNTNPYFTSPEYDAGYVYTWPASP